MKRSSTIARVLAPVFSLSLLAGYVTWSHQSAQVSAADTTVVRAVPVPVPWEAPLPRSHALQPTLAEQLEQGELHSHLTSQTGPSRPEFEPEKIQLKSRPPQPFRLMSSSKSAQVFAEPVPGTLWHSVAAMMMADDHDGVSGEVSPQMLEQKRMEQRILRPHYDIQMSSSKSAPILSPQMVRNFGKWKNVWHPLTELLLPVHSNTPVQGPRSVLQPAP